MERYCFVGVVEHLQASFDALAAVLGKRAIKLPMLNRSQANSEHARIRPELKRRFERQNALDYEIYRKAREQLTRVSRIPPVNSEAPVK